MKLKSASRQPSQQHILLSPATSYEDGFEAGNAFTVRGPAARNSSLDVLNQQITGSLSSPASSIKSCYILAATQAIKTVSIAECARRSLLSISQEQGRIICSGEAIAEFFEVFSQTASQILLYLYDNTGCQGRHTGVRQSFLEGRNGKSRTILSALKEGFAKFFEVLSQTPSQILLYLHDNTSYQG